MSQLRIDAPFSAVSVHPTRQRQTPAAGASFKGLLRQGMNVLLSGAQTATAIVGSPILTAAVANAGAGLRGGGALGGGLDGQEALKSIGQQGLDDDLKLLALQNEIQRRDRQISLISNVLKSKHETAKSAISNIRA